MTQNDRPDPFFLADNAALDFLNSIAAPSGEEIEWIGCGEDLLNWLGLAGLVPNPVLARFRTEQTPETLDDISAQARDLREWFREFITTHTGKELTAAALLELDKLNHLLAKNALYHQIEIKQDFRETESLHTSLHWQQHQHWSILETLLLPIAEAMGNLISKSNFRHVKNCEGPTCSLWFHDVSKNHTRRWCSMSMCGNRAKAAKHRTKKRPPNC